MKLTLNDEFFAQTVRAVRQFVGCVSWNNSSQLFAPDSTNLSFAFEANYPEFGLDHLSLILTERDGLLLSCYFLAVCNGKVFTASDDLSVTPMEKVKQPGQIKALAASACRRLEKLEFPMPDRIIQETEEQKAFLRLVADDNANSYVIESDKIAGF